MSAAPKFSGWWRHVLLCLKLNFRSPAAIVYGYAVPVLFLLAFGAIFRGDIPPLQHEMGQLLTITILGGTCFGMPTALVAERERGVWRRYRLLPISTNALVLGSLIARVALVASAVMFQIALARLIHGTPWPAHPFQMALAFCVVAASFLGLGLLIAALANDVPAVQALGQCVFLPMIMIGGVGVPLVVLPEWAQRISGFMPGRYAVDLLQRATSDPRGLDGASFSVIALLVIGGAAGVIGTRLFRWDTARAVSRRAGFGIAGALLAWVLVGTAAAWTGRLQPVRSMTAYAEISAADIDAIRFDDLPGDNELATRLAPPFTAGKRPERVSEIAAWLKVWPPGRTGDVVEDIRHLLSVAAIADIGADLQEAEIARAVFDELQTRYPHPQLRKILAWIILHPNEGTVVPEVPELALRRARPPETMIRERSALYARKLLGRLTGKIGET